MDRLYDSLSKYELIIFDMDGTLYFQKGMQIRMALALIGNALTGRHGLRDLRLILRYRKLREAWDAGRELDEGELYGKLAEQTGMESAEVEGIISFWMFEKPMDIVRKCRDERLVEVIGRLMSSGRTVCIYSDYPTEDKCRAVGLPEGIPQFYPGKDEIKTMKPNPSALFYIMGRYPDVMRDKVIMVGDRADRDKAAADNAGIDCLILPRFKVQRRK